MSVPGVWSAVTPPMFPCVCDGITFEREDTRIGRERGEEGPTWILPALRRVCFGCFRTSSKRLVKAFFFG